jgi:hypothetical protein
MRSLLLFGFIVLGLSVTAVARVINGTLLNGDDPYFIKGDDGNVYKAEWYSGSALFFEGDEVILTGTFGLVKMIDDDSDETADVYVEEVSEGHPRQRMIPVPVPDLTPQSSAPSYPAVEPTATPIPVPVPTAKPTPRPDYSNTKWPDDRLLIHPEHFIKAHVINVRPHDTLALRSGPRTSFEPITEIPADGTDILVFDHDEVWDGDSWWYPVVWHGFRGYAGRHYLSADH